MAPKQLMRPAPFVPSGFAPPPVGLHWLVEDGLLDDLHRGGRPLHRVPVTRGTCQSTPRQFGGGITQRQVGGGLQAIRRKAEHGDKEASSQSCRGELQPTVGVAELTRPFVFWWPSIQNDRKPFVRFRASSFQEYVVVFAIKRKERRPKKKTRNREPALSVALVGFGQGKNTPRP